MEITLNQIIDALASGYPVTIIINGEYYTLKKGDEKQ